MRVRIDFTRSAQQNADQFYKASKKLAAKREGAERTIKELEKKLADAERKQQKNELKEKQKFIKKTEKQWYEKFHWFFTSGGMLAVGGRDAQQNDMVNSKYFSDSDLFFHAEIFGASAVVLKEGASAGKEAREEAAQFAACYSSAWEEGLRTVDVYAMRRDQISKLTGKAGSFLLSGEREWYRNTQLSLVMFVKDGRLNAVPAVAFGRMDSNQKHVVVNQGNRKKSDAAKRISELLDYNDLDEIIRQLPSGSFSVSTGAQK